jgi:hypothetical protein
MEGSSALQKHVAACYAAQGIRMDVAVQCSTWFEVAEAMKQMKLAGILPKDVTRALGEEFYECSVPGLSSYKDSYALAWSPVLAKKNSTLARWVSHMAKRT